MSVQKPGRRAPRAEAPRFINSLTGSALPNAQPLSIRADSGDIPVPMRDVQRSPTPMGAAATTRSMSKMQRCRCMTPPARMAIRPLPLLCVRGLEHCASRGEIHLKREEI